MSDKPWGESRFYTFWSAGERIMSKEREIFEICNVTSFTYREISLDLENCLDAAIDLENQDSLHPVTEAERKYLKGKMAEFLIKIDTYYARIEK